MASFIKGNKIWNRIEKKYLKENDVFSETGLCGAFDKESTVRFVLDLNISASKAKMRFFSDADCKRTDFEMSKGEDGNFFLEIPVSKSAKKSGLFFYEYLLENAHGEFFVVRDNADFSEKIIFS